MNNLRNFMRNLPLLTASQASVCQVDILGDDLLSELGAGGGNFSSVNSLAAFDMANDLAGLEGLEGLEGDEDEVGARVRRIARARGMNPAALMRQLVAAGASALKGGAKPAGTWISSVVDGTPARGERFSYIPFPSGQFSALSTSTSFVLRTTAQRYLRPVRVSATERRKGAADILLTITEVKIGQEVQPAATGALGFDAFSPFAVNIPVDFDPVPINTPVEVTVQCSSIPTGADLINFAVSFHGPIIK